MNNFDTTIEDLLPESENMKPMKTVKFLDIPS